LRLLISAHAPSATLGGVVRTFLLAAILAALALPAAGSELEELRRARALADELMSPFCPGRTLSDCPSPNAAAVREEIRVWIDQGRSDAEIRAELRARFGDALAGEPESPWGRGAPLAVIALVGVLFALGVRRVVAR
jgi:cytochrome c-type biogenesis protein CcmH/NrfF